MTLTSGHTPITDAQGEVDSSWLQDPGEPQPGSVVLTNGEWGTAFQRYFNDGLWHRVGGGRGRTWEWMLTQRNVVLVYDAPTRKEARP